MGDGADDGESAKPPREAAKAATTPTAKSLRDRPKRARSASMRARANVLSDDDEEHQVVHVDIFFTM